MDATLTNHSITTITVPVTADAERHLRQRAAEQGLPLEDFARTVLEREAAAAKAAAWIANWKAFVASRPRIDHFVDDSRESICEGCGE